MRNSADRPWAFVAEPLILAIPAAVSLGAMTLPPTAASCALVAFVAFAAVVIIMVSRVVASGGELPIGWLAFYGGVQFWFLFPSLQRALADDWYTRAFLLVATPRSYIYAQCAISLFVLAFSIAYAIPPWNPATRWLGGVLGNGIRYSPYDASRWAFATVVVCIGFYIVASGGVSGFFHNVMASRAAEKPWSADGNYGTPMARVNTVVTGLAYLATTVLGDSVLRSRVGLGQRVIAAGLWVGTTAVVTLISGTRTNLLLCVGAALLLYVRAWSRHGLKIGRVLVMATIVGGLLIGAAFVRQNRFNRGGYGEGGEVELTLSGDADFASATAIAVEVWNAEGRRLFRESALWSIVVNPIPRSWWPDKPDSDIMARFSWYFYGRNIRRLGGNAIPSIVGQYLMGWGWWGPLEIGLALGVLFRWGDAALAKASDRTLFPIAWSCFVVWVVASFRMIGPSFVYGVYILVVGVAGVRIWRELVRGPSASGKPLSLERW